MDELTAFERLLKTIDILHPNLAVDALRLAQAIDELIEARLQAASSASDPKRGSPPFPACEAAVGGSNSPDVKQPDSAGDNNG